MTDQFHIQVRTREETGKNSNRRLRASGQIPAVLYGAGVDTVPIQVERKKVEEVFRSGATENTIFLLKRLESDLERHARIRELQIDPVSREVLHIDFQRVLMDQVIQISVPVHLVGTARGVREQAGMVDFVTREVEVECLPADIPAAIEIDISDLMIGDHLEAGALKVPEGVTLLEDAERVIVSVTYPQRAEETEEEEAEELLEAEREEPEVIRRGKEEDEEGEEAED